MTFRQAENRLRTLLQEKIRRGEMSERRLALVSGYTQPHIHNVLKGVRGVNGELADAILKHLHMSIEDLLGSANGGSGETEAAIPVGAGRIGPQDAFPERTSQTLQCRLPACFVAGFADPVMWQLAGDEDSMAPLVEPGDWAVVDRVESERRSPEFEGVYALSLEGRGAICRCQRVGSLLVLLADNARSAIRLPDRVPLASYDIVDIVRGRLRWVCRKL